MSADIAIWKAGAAHASVIRRAIVLRNDVSSTRSTAPLGRGTTAGAAGADVTSARSTSSATMRPSGPVPRSRERSMPRSRAILRASGEALIRPPSVLAAAGAGAADSTGAA